MGPHNKLMVGIKINIISRSEVSTEEGNAVELAFLQSILQETSPLHPAVLILLLPASISL